MFASPFTCKSLVVTEARFLEVFFAEISLGVDPADTFRGVGPADTVRGVGPAETFRGVGPADTFLGVVSALLLLLRPWTSPDGDGGWTSELFLLMPDSWLCKLCSLLMDCDKLSSMSSRSSSVWLRAESGLKMLCGPSDRSDAWAPSPLVLPLLVAPALIFVPAFRGCKSKKKQKNPCLLPVQCKNTHSMICQTARVWNGTKLGIHCQARLHVIV